MFWIVGEFGKLVLAPILHVGKFAFFVKSSLQSVFLSPPKFMLLLRQIEFVGNRSVVIIVLSGIMVGGIFGFQLGEIFKIFGAESMIGAAAGFALSRELAPVIGSFLVTGRAGSAIAAELAIMKVNEQIDAMRVMSVDPISYLVAPRILAAMIILPVLTVMFILSGVAAAYVIGFSFFEVDTADFITKIRWIVSINDVFLGMQKAAFFGWIYATVGCYQGFSAKGGARGVGAATTRAVVYSYVAILIFDYVISFIQFSL